jgi:carbonic anhydrase
VVYKKLAVATLAVLGLQMGTCLADQDQKSHGPKHWSYEGETGAAHWGSLAEEYALCGNGKQQSPIDITNSITTDLPSLEFNYSAIPLTIQNNGHTIKIMADKAGSLTIGDDTYQLLQFHTHAPSEGAINGQRADMVIHMVHKKAQEKLELAVVSVYLETGKTTNPLIDTLWKVMPTKSGKPQHHDDIEIDINQLLPKDKSYYTFEGSLTTPPCTEGVKWIILKQPVVMEADQLTQFHAVYRNNARPLQPLNDRKVFSSN